MGPGRTYLDHNASSPLRPAAKTAILAAADLDGNPTSIHAEGRACRRCLERGRQVVASAVGAEPDGVIFTSGATEANDLACNQTRGTMLASAVEHPSVLEARGCERLPVDPSGRLDLAALERRLRSGDVDLVALMAANNETGVVQPVAEAARLARRHGAVLHVDAVQVLGRMPLSLAALGADTIALSAHKIGGPKGVGALVHASGVAVRARLRGGGQEHRLRAGTENLIGIASFAAAIEAIAADEAPRIDALRRRLEAAVDVGIVVGGGAARLCSTVALALPGMDAASQVMALDLDGIAVSAGAACSSGKVERSHVLSAMGLPDEIVRSTIRVSLGWNTTEADVDRFVAAWLRLRRRVRSAGRAVSV